MPETVQPPIIFLAFAREDIPRYQVLPRLTEEQKQLRALLDPAVRAGRCELLERPAVTIDEILSVFQDDRYRNRIAVFHFGGHADGYSLLVEAGSGSALAMGAGGLAEFLAAQTGLKLVFLNACSTADQAQALHAAGVPAVVVTSEDVDDGMALRFAICFYRGLAGGSSLGEAFSEAQGALRAESYAERAELDPRSWVLSADEAAKRWRLPVRTMRSTGPVPMQKPLRAQHFIGREQELAKLLEELQPGKAVTLCGPGGIGKSALAAEAVWCLAPDDEPPDQFCDGIIFHTFENQPQVDLALEAVARSFGIEPRPTPRDAARRALAGRKVLLVVDGAENADDLPVLLATAPSCGVLITTRRHSDAPSDFRDLAPLQQHESIDLLRAWGGEYAADEQAVSQILILVGGLPLALFLAGRYLVRQQQQASEYVEWLQNAGLDALHFGSHQGESIPLLLRRSLAQVSEGARAAFSVAGILAQAPFIRDRVSAALEVTPTAASRVLGELVDYGLLVRSGKGYQITHSLAHRYARDNATPRMQVVNRLAMHYSDLVTTESQKGSLGYAVLNDERPHIVAVQAAALRVGQWHAVCEIARNTKDFFNLQGYWTERSILVQAGLDAAKAAGDRHLESVFLSNLGSVHFSLGELNRAIELYTQQLRVAQDIPDTFREANALGDLGNAYYSLGDPRRAIQLYEQQLVLVRKIDDRIGEGAALGNLGMVYNYLGEPHRALELFNEQLAIMQDCGGQRRIGYAFGNLGNAYRNLRQPERAIDFLDQYLAIMREVGDRKGECNALGNLGRALADLGQHTRSIGMYERQLEIAREIRYPRGEANALGNLGLAYVELGEYHRAIDLHRRQLEIARELNDHRGQAISSWHLGQAYEKVGYLAEAIAYMNARVAYEQRIDHPEVGIHMQHIEHLQAGLGT